MSEERGEAKDSMPGCCGDWFSQSTDSDSSAGGSTGQPKEFDWSAAMKKMMVTCCGSAQTSSAADADENEGEK